MNMMTGFTGSSAGITSTPEEFLMVSAMAETLKEIGQVDQAELLVNEFLASVWNASYLQGYNNGKDSVAVKNPWIYGTPEGVILEEQSREIAAHIDDMIMGISK